MKWPADTKDFALPVRDADAGQPAESAMRLGVSGIRTVEHVQSDGSVLRLSHRGGYPIYETVAGGAGSQQKYRRGFVAVVPGATTGTLFNPYNLAVVQHGFKPAGARYYVLDYATSWNVSPSDTTKWRDVIVFDGNKILINGLRMAPPLLDLASVPSGSVPYFINSGLSDRQYGRMQDRRTFAVARELVKSWASTGITETLTPTTPRTDEKALTIGPAIVRSMHKAWLGQIYYTGTSATDNAGAWAFSQREVNMMLASPFLSGTNSNALVDMAVPGFGAGVASSGSGNWDITLPPTEIGMYSTPTSTQEQLFSQRYDYYDPQVPTPSTGNFAGRFNYAGTVSRELQGVKSGSYTRTTYTAATSASVQITNKQFDFVLNNSKIFDSRTTSSRVKSQTVVFDASIEGVDSTTGSNMTGNYTGLYWGQHFTTPPTDGLNARMPGPHGGKTSRLVDLSSIGGTNETRNHEVQTLSASITSGAMKLVELLATRNYSYGQLSGYTPSTGYYASYIGSPWSPVYSGMGVYGRASWKLEAYSNPSTDEVWIRYYEATTQNIPGGGTWYKQTQSTQDKINAKYQQVHNAIMAQTERYDDESSSGIMSRTFYYGYVSPSVTQLSQSLTWQTSDFILFDEDNGVYVRIDGHFSGQDADATLTVSLVIETRHDTTTIQLLTRNYTYSDLLPEHEIGTTGKYAVPSPQVRAMFAPLHREQGSFKGAHYVTLDEESAGADPAHLFSLQLVLHSFSDMGQVNALNGTDAGVHFVPFNLLEMLYCFVFSQDYGVGASTLQRYPVTFSARYNDLMANLFGVPFNVTVRDGVETPWTHSLHRSFVGVHGASLHRV